MITLDVDPQATIPAPRPMPDEVVILICDTNGARSWLKMSKKLFGGEVPAILAFLEDGIARMYQQEGKSPPPEWALDPATLAARNAATATPRRAPRTQAPGHPPSA